MIDSSVWVALFEDAAFIDELGRAQADRIPITSPIVLAELASLATRGRAPDLLETVREAARVVEMTNEDAISGGSLHGALRRDAGSKVSLADCIIYATAQRLGGSLITCDADLAAQPGVVVLGARRRPRRAPR